LQNTPEIGPWPFLAKGTLLASPFLARFSIGELGPDTGWMMTSGNVNGKKDGKDFTFPVNISLSVKKEGGKWLIAAMHFSTLTDEVQDEE
jgi:hypothetical protein